MAEAQFPYLDPLDELGFDGNSSYSGVGALLSGANSSSFPAAVNTTSSIMPDHTNHIGRISSDLQPTTLYQKPHDIWKNFLPSAAALISNSASQVVPPSTAAQSASSSLFPVAKPQLHELRNASSNLVTSSQILPNSIFMERIPNNSWGSRLSSTLSAHSGNPSLLFNSISTIATSTGGYWDSVANAGNNATGVTDSTSATDRDIDYDYYPEDELRVSMSLAILLCVAYGLVFVVGIIGNSFVVAVVFRSPRMRTPTNFFIANLAVADLLVVLFCLPATLIANIYSG